MSLSRLLVFVSVLLVVSGTASATTWNVAQSGCNNTTCSPCCNIQAAVEKASGGDTISVSPGIYPEQVDIRNMLSIGDITFLAAAGPSTVLIAPTAGVVMTHSGFDTNTVTVDGIDVTSPDESGFFLAHSGDVVMRDVRANDCGYTAFQIDATGTVTLERCTGNGSGRTGIQVDSAASAQLTDCTANSNDSHGIHIISVSGTVEMISPTAVQNTDEGISFENEGTNTVTDATVTDNGRKGVRALISGSISIIDSTITGSFAQGIDIESDGVGLAAGVTLTDTEVNNNGHGSGDSGVRLRDVDGPVVVTNCFFDNNGADGFSPEISVVGDLEIYGGRANGNQDDGFDLRVFGNATVIGARAINNVDAGFTADIPGTVFFQDCVANDNQQGAGFDLQWQDPDPIDGATVIDCTANNNGLAGGGNGIRVKHIAGSVTIAGTTTNGNSRTGVRVDELDGSVLISDVVSNSGLEEGIKIDADTGPVTIVGSTTDGNVLEGIKIESVSIELEEVTLERNLITNNIDTGVAFIGFGDTGVFEATCNDIAGNGFGFYLDGNVTIDARHVWWGHPSGPSSQGPGTGDGVFAEPGGDIDFDPWLAESFTAPVSGCPLFEADFEFGNLAEWEVVVP